MTEKDAVKCRLCLAQWWYLPFDAVLPSAPG
ncbi:hypothetical protein M8494_16335 [Serratia ureilytica]